MLRHVRCKARNRFSLVGTLVFLVLSICCSNANRSGATTNPEIVFRAYEVARLQDTELSIPVTASDGNEWFRRRKPVFDSRCAKPDGCHVGRQIGSDFGVWIFTTPTASTEISAWTRAHIGRSIAIMIDGEVVHLEEIKTTIGSAFLFGHYPDRESAEAICTRIRQSQAR